MVEILVVKDREDDYKIKKPPSLPDLPMRGVIVGKSQYSGKTNLLCNMIVRPFGKEDQDGMDFYRDNFLPENIFIISPSVHTDEKLRTLIEALEIPQNSEQNNIMDHYDEQSLNSLYEHLERDYHEAIEEDRTPTHKLVILDDCSYSGDLKSKIHGVISKLFCNGRHLLCSTIITSQKWSDVSTTVRENCTFAITFSCTDKQLDLITEDYNILPSKKEFKKLFREITAEPYSFMMINYKNRIGEGRYLNTKLEPADSHITKFGEIDKKKESKHQV